MESTDDHINLTAETAVNKSAEAAISPSTEADMNNSNGNIDSLPDVPADSFVTSPSKDVIKVAAETKAAESQPEVKVPKISEDDLIKFKVIYNKTKYDIEFSAGGTIAKLKEHLQSIVDVPPAMQKIMVKGLAKDDKTLKECGVVSGAKVMLVGSTLNDVLKVSSTPSAQELKEEASSSSSKEPLSKQKMHKKILDKGKPDDVMLGIKNCKDSLPSIPLSGMLNKHGGKVRLTFKLEVDQLWIGTKERTDKIPMNSIKNVISETIEGHEQYHIMAIQLGPTDASRYWLYWVPAQYVDAIKDAILGKWQF